MDHVFAQITLEDEDYLIDLDDPIDLSLPFAQGEKNVNAWYVPPVRMEPIFSEHFVGSVAKGGPVNFRNITLNPHGNGTHTEGVGHIAEEVYSVNQCLDRSFLVVKVISIEPETVQEPDGTQEKGDKVITEDQLKKALRGGDPEGVVIRTLPNPVAKKTRHYSNTNPPYLEAEAAKLIRDRDIQHLLIDLPSVDKENDGGKLAAHHAFWEYPQNPRMRNTITELIYVPSSVKDGTYLLDLQVAPVENDAAPSRPLLFALHEK